MFNRKEFSEDNIPCEFYPVYEKNQVTSFKIQELCISHLFCCFLVIKKKKFCWELFDYQPSPSFLVAVDWSKFNELTFVVSLSLKPQDSFGIWRKIKRDYYFFVNAWFYRSVWTINALFIVHSKLLSFWRNNPNIKMFGVPPNTIP